VLHEFRVIINLMKNVTITVDDAVLEWVRIDAAKRNTSVSRLVGEMLAEKMQREDAYARAMREWQSDNVTLTSNMQPLPRRAEIYAERTARFR
jgi:predicted transcriptional regulator